MGNNTAAQGPIRAACYCRISSDPNDKREGVTRQREDTAALCEIKGWQIAGVYIDNDRSASNGKGRPEWERLLADIEAGEIDAVAAWDQDRVNRMMEDFERYKKIFVRHRVLLATSNNGDIDLSTPSGVLTAQIKTAVAEHEIAMMKIRMKRAAQQCAEKGLPKWKRAFGYLPDTRRKEDDDGTRQLDPVTAPLVRQGYGAIVAGSSLREVAQMWNAAKAFGRAGKPWNESLVSQFLRKPRNAGLRDYEGEIIGKGTWPALVDEALWHAAQTALDNRPNGGRGKRRTMRKHLLSGLLWCGREGCDGHLNARHLVGKIAYTCTVCRGVAVRADNIEPLLITVVGSRLAEPDAVDLLKAEIHDAAEAQAIRDEKAALYTRLDELAIERAEGLMTGRQLQIANQSIQEKIDALDVKQHDQERRRVFDGIPLGVEDAVAAVAALSPDRFRAVMGVLMRVTIMPVGKGSHRFSPERVVIDWH